MKKSILGFFLIMLALPVFSQKNNLGFHTQFGILHQLDMNYPNYDWGMKIGISASKEYKLGILTLDGELLSMTNDNGDNDFAGRSLALKLNLLFKTWEVNDKFIYLGPGLGLFAPISNSYGVGNGYSFKAMYPIHISRKPFNLVYDFDINIYGYYRNSIGLSYRF